ncbi:hypothetical protein OXPF_19990 [Oxobacter pfennigii]|uniref:Uncharacterized protein n=1 Tax=Oxobacter pfennigii TaxID=36849 RepID=A0A0P8YXD0_9CLOT|nr:hypothetical protein OXPF_19990 [Oxobacter pfennigii]
MIAVLSPAKTINMKKKVNTGNFSIPPKPPN